MISHTYHIHLDSPIIRLSNVDDLLGKDVEVIVRERTTESLSNFNAIEQLLADQASTAFFGQIADPVEWQKRLRDEWEYVVV